MLQRWDLLSWFGHGLKQRTPVTEVALCPPPGNDPAKDAHELVLFIFEPLQLPAVCKPRMIQDWAAHIAQVVWPGEQSPDPNALSLCAGTPRA